jgi:hypothetical protein
MRGDADIYRSAALEMTNFFPTLQGAAVRSPGTRFVMEAMADDARIIPYMTPENKRALLELVSGQEPVLHDDIFENLRPTAGVATYRATTVRQFQIVENNSFRAGIEPWDVEPMRYLAGSGDPLGAWLDGDTLYMSVREYKPKYDNIDAEVGYIRTTAQVKEAQPDGRVLVRYAMRLAALQPLETSTYKWTVKVGTTEGGDDVYSQELRGAVKTIHDETASGTLPSTSWTGTLYVEIRIEALRVGDVYSGVTIAVNRFQLWASQTVTYDPAVIVGTVPYSADELKDVQYVQSPYGRKDLVLVHPQHPPLKFWLSDTGYRLEQIAFADQPPVWGSGNYPAACASFQGRLVLGGAEGRPDLGSPLQPATETVWCSKVGNWYSFEYGETIEADDPVEFTSTYRSPIQWIYGQKDLLIGAREMEYIASSEGIFSPGDLGVYMQSTNGSINVQPIGFGETVLFASDAGTKVRALRRNSKLADDGGDWVAPDMNLLHPLLCRTGIKRLVRMRNPHQMAIAVLGSGQLAVLHHDSNAGVMGWSRLNYGGGVKDACVVTDEDGVDALFMVIRRQAKNDNGKNIRKTYIEAIANWTTELDWDFNTSTAVFVNKTPTSKLQGLTHLRGMKVQVTADQGYLGTFTVDMDGDLQLFDDNGNEITVFSASVGLPTFARLRTLPLFETGIEPYKRYTKLVLRLFQSATPIINGHRPPVRYPGSPMDTRQQFNFDPDVLMAGFGVSDIEIPTMGKDRNAIVTIEENIPLRVEILGIFGTLEGQSL